MSIVFSLYSQLSYRVFTPKASLNKALKDLDFIQPVYHFSAGALRPTLASGVEPTYLKSKRRLYLQAIQGRSLSFKLTLSNANLLSLLTWVLTTKVSVFYKGVNPTLLTLSTFNLNSNFLTSFKQRSFYFWPQVSPWFESCGALVSLSSRGVVQPISTISMFKYKPYQTGLGFLLISERNKLRGILTSTYSESKFKGSNVRTNSSVLTEVPAASLAAMFGYSRRYQKTPFVRLSLLKYFRRYFLVLEQLRLDIVVRGIMRNFKTYFKTINSPLNQIIKNPITDVWIADFSQPVSFFKEKKQSVEGISSAIRAMLADSLLSVETVDINVTSKSEEWSYLDKLTAELTSFFLTKLGAAEYMLAHNNVVLHRYRLTWEHVSFQKVVEHGLKKKKKARSIKKRRTKRLVRKAKYRFWNL